MTDRSTSWFDQDELKSLFKGLRPAGAAPGPGPAAPEPAAPEASAPQEAAQRPVVPAPPTEPAPPPPAAIAEPAPAAEAPDETDRLALRHSEALLGLLGRQSGTQLLGERLWEITETAAAVLEASRASIWTFDSSDRTRLVCRDLYAAARDAHEAGALQSAADYPLYFAALYSERPIVTGDALHDPRTRELVAGSLAAQGRLECPVFVAGRIAGVLRLECEAAARHFTHADERFVAALADLGGLALEAQERRDAEARAQAAEEQLRGQLVALTLLARSEALGRGQLDALLAEVTGAALKSLQAERCSVWIYAPDFKSLFCLDLCQRASVAHERGQEIRQEEMPAYFEVLREGGWLETEDAGNDPRLRELVQSGLLPPGIVARLETPIRLQGRLAGSLWIERKAPPTPWLQDDEHLAEALAALVALSIATSERRKSEAELRQTVRDLGMAGEPPAFQGADAAEEGPAGG